MSDLRVELLAVEDCPHFERTRRELEAVLREGIIETPIQVVLVTSLDDAEFLGFPGSPTVRINGEDVVRQTGLGVGLGCRIYRDEEGRVLAGPPVEAMRAAVQAHRRGRLQAFQREEAGKVAAFAAAASDEEDRAEKVAEPANAEESQDTSPDRNRTEE